MGDDVAPAFVLFTEAANALRDAIGSSRSVSLSEGAARKLLRGTVRPAGTRPDEWAEYVLSTLAKTRSIDVAGGRVTPGDEGRKSCEIPF